MVVHGYDGRCVGQNRCPENSPWLNDTYGQAPHRQTTQGQDRVCRREQHDPELKIGGKKREAKKKGLALARQPSEDYKL